MTDHRGWKGQVPEMYLGRNRLIHVIINSHPNAGASPVRTNVITVPQKIDAG
jgi:hypothetical protein